jgi:hypothetical protein
MWASISRLVHTWAHRGVAHDTWPTHCGPPPIGYADVSDIDDDGDGDGNDDDDDDDDDEVGASATFSRRCCSHAIRGIDRRQCGHSIQPHAHSSRW